MRVTVAHSDSVQHFPKHTESDALCTGPWRGGGACGAPAHPDPHGFKPTSSLAWVSGAPLLRAGTVPAASTHPPPDIKPRMQKTQLDSALCRSRHLTWPRALKACLNSKESHLPRSSRRVSCRGNHRATCECVWGGHWPHPCMREAGWLRRPACGLGHRYSGRKGDFILWIQRLARAPGRPAPHCGPPAPWSRGLPWRVRDSIRGREAGQPHILAGSRGSWEPRAPLTTSFTLSLTTS